MSHPDTACRRKAGPALLACALIWLAVPAQAQPTNAKTAASTAAQGVDLDLVISYYNRVLTPEGVLRESRYQETMLRRPGHVWSARVLPAAVAVSPSRRAGDGAGAPKAGGPDQHGHRHFNHVLLPRHVTHTGDTTRLEYIDADAREVIAIVPSEYENVSFDGSWANAFFLADPKIVATLPLTNRASPVAGARWHELSRDGAYQRVLWDEKRMVPLVIEKGDDKGSFLQRMEVKVQPAVTSALPWSGVGRYAQKDYADFLD